MAKAFADNARDVPLRLSRTICWWDGEPYYVTSVGDRARRNGEDLPRGMEWNKVTLTPVHDPSNYSRNQVVDYTDDKFTWEMPPLGYINGKMGAAYLMRTPARIQKKGLCQEGCTLAEDQHPLGDYFYTKGMVAMLKNEYPTIQHALRKVVEGELQSMSHHRDVAFESLGSTVVGLKYKGRLVGVRRQDDVFDIFQSPETSILRKFIEEAGVKV